MSNIKTAVVFDTNSYRNVVRNKSTEETLKAITELIELEKKKGIQAYGIQIVGLELLANLYEGETEFNETVQKSVSSIKDKCFT